MIELPQIILTINPSLFLVNSTLEEAAKLEELKLLYGPNWIKVYTDILNKKRLNSSLDDTSSYKEVCDINNNIVNSNK